jgi:hypothetical protein
MFQKHAGTGDRRHFSRETNLSRIKKKRKFPQSTGFESAGSTSMLVKMICFEGKVLTNIY